MVVNFKYVWGLIVTSIKFFVKDRPRRPFGNSLKMQKEKERKYLKPNLESLNNWIWLENSKFDSNENHRFELKILINSAERLITIRNLIWSLTSYSNWDLKNKKWNISIRSIWIFRIRFVEHSWSLLDLKPPPLFPLSFYKRPEPPSLSWSWSRPALYSQHQSFHFEK